MSLLPTFITPVIRVTDGDTVRLNVKLSPTGLWDHGQTNGGAAVRLCGIQAAEMTSKDPAEKARATAARDRLAELILNRPVRVDVVKCDKYRERYDARLVMDDGRDVAEVLIGEGLVVAWNGTGERPLGEFER